MTLDREDITAIAAEVVRLMRQMDDRRLDAEFLATRPIEERKAIQQEKARKAREAMKAGKGR